MVVPIIPAFNPDDKLIDIVHELKKYFNKIIIVDDGSFYKGIFNELKDDSSYIVLNHDVNKGKGEALKTAFSYYKKNLINDYNGIITLDCDGQHAKDDVIEMSKLVKEEDRFILGTRLFNTKETPLRNKIGNRITSKLFKLLYNVYLKDTQTGLRAFPNRLINDLIEIDGSRFEYEMNVLIKMVKMHEEIIEYDIKTIYLENSNKKSNFKVFKDSYQIYKLMFRKRK